MVSYTIFTIFKDLFSAKLNRFITLFLIYFMSLMIAYFDPIKNLFIFWQFLHAFKPHLSYYIMNMYAPQRLAS
jgi:hypothetical protein